MHVCDHCKTSDDILVHDRRIYILSILEANNGFISSFSIFDDFLMTMEKIDDALIHFSIVPDEIILGSARIVDSRIVSGSGKSFVEYKVLVKTASAGTVYCWKRYSAFR